MLSVLLGRGGVRYLSTSHYLFTRTTLQSDVVDLISFGIKLVSVHLGFIERTLITPSNAQSVLPIQSSAAIDQSNLHHGLAIPTSRYRIRDFQSLRSQTRSYRAANATIPTSLLCASGPCVIRRRLPQMLPNAKTN